jgi:hypothetical protein
VTIRKIDKRAAPLSGREVIGFLFADLYEQSGDKIAAATAYLSIGYSLEFAGFNGSKISSSDYT